jgi:hypothetical protein
MTRELGRWVGIRPLVNHQCRFREGRSSSSRDNGRQPTCTCGRRSGSGTRPFENGRTTLVTAAAVNTFWNLPQRCLPLLRQAPFDLAAPRA